MVARTQNADDKWIHLKHSRKWLFSLKTDQVVKIAKNGAIINTTKLSDTGLGVLPPGYSLHTATHDILGTTQIRTAQNYTYRPHLDLDLRDYYPYFRKSQGLH